MKIAESVVALSSTHQKIEEHQRREHLVAWQKGKEPEEFDSGKERGRDLKAMAMEFQAQATKVSLSQAAQVQRSQASQEVVPATDASREPMESLNMRILKAIFEKITGKKFSLRDPAEIAEAIATAEAEQAPVSPEQQATETTSVPENPGVGWGVVYDSHETHYEKESTSFSAAGVVRTEDGREIDFSVQLNMSREFLSEQHISLRAGDALKDPLVVNFDGSAAQLTQTEFAFDIDADGQEDQIAFVRPGSGFLALDKNTDGTINDGSELFGALSGDGFADLAAYDLDENGWIDENDTIYDRLRIWSKDQSGADQLLALGQRGVGAIYLGHVATPFDLKDSSNALQGQVRSSGVYLHEDGAVGTIQQVDLVA